jgi:hypothetical protein
MQDGLPIRLFVELRQPAITCRWTSHQNFPRRIVLDDRFTATNSELALAQPGQERKFDDSGKPLSERLLDFETWRNANSHNSV